MDSKGALAILISPVVGGNWSPFFSWKYKKQMTKKIMFGKLAAENTVQNFLGCY